MIVKLIHAIMIVQQINIIILVIWRVNYVIINAKVVKDLKIINA